MSECLPYRPGAVFEHPYPFFRTTYTEYDEDGAQEMKSWAPGVRSVMCAPDDCEGVADGMGTQQLTVVGSYKPGRFPERVFYTRQWIGPDGKKFGKSRLYIKTASGFRNLVNGYRYDFRMAGKNDAQKL